MCYRVIHFITLLMVVVSIGVVSCDSDSEEKKSNIRPVLTKPLEVSDMWGLDFGMSLAIMVEVKATSVTEPGRAYYISLSCEGYDHGTKTVVWKDGNEAEVLEFDIPITSKGAKYLAEGKDCDDVFDVSINLGPK